MRCPFEYSDIPGFGLGHGILTVLNPKMLKTSRDEIKTNSPLQKDAPSSLFFAQGFTDHAALPPHEWVTTGRECRHLSKTVRAIGIRHMCQ